MACRRVIGVVGVTTPAALPCAQAVSISPFGPKSSYAGPVILLRRQNRSSPGAGSLILNGNAPQSANSACNAPPLAFLLFGERWARLELPRQRAERTLTFSAAQRPPRPAGACPPEGRPNPGAVPPTSVPRLPNGSACARALSVRPAVLHGAEHYIGNGPKLFMVKRAIAEPARRRNARSSSFLSFPCLHGPTRSHPHPALHPG